MAAAASPPAAGHTQAPDHAAMLGAAERALLRQVFAGARGLPGRWFTDPAPFATEMAALFAGGWACIGFAEDVPGPGDLFPVTLAGRPLLMVRDGTGDIGVFHNSCRHRGALLATAPEQGRRFITCPYHCWMYGLDGALEKTPNAGGAAIHVTPEVSRAELGLKRVRSAVWAGHVFVDLSGRAEPFETWIAPVAHRLAHVDHSVMRHDPAGDATFDVRANWKAIIENFVESYHLPMVHPELEAYNPMAAHYQILGGTSYSGQGGKAFGAGDNPAPAPGQDLPRHASFAGLGFDYEGLAIHPNIIITAGSFATFSLLLLPQAPDRTVERLRIWFVGDQAMADSMQPARHALGQSLRLVNQQDIDIVQNCQIGRGSVAFGGGVFLTRQEATSLLVQRQIAGRLLAAAGEDVAWETLPVGDIHHAPAAAADA